MEEANMASLHALQVLNLLRVPPLKVVVELHSHPVFHGS